MLKLKVCLKLLMTDSIRRGDFVYVYRLHLRLVAAQRASLSCVSLEICGSVNSWSFGETLQLSRL